MTPQTIDPESPAACRLIELSDQYVAALYPSESIHLESVQSLKEPNVHFVGVQIDDRLVACGAVRVLRDDGEYGEIKRVFVHEEHRGKGYSRLIMQNLEQHLRQAGVKFARLVTGAKQPEALGLYRNLGYHDREPFGAYAAGPSSVFMEKYIGA